MTEIKSGAARALADLAQGEILATVEIAAPPERVFSALASKEIVDWWVRPGVFDTREWTGDVRKGGRWRASGVARGQPYALEGEFLEVQPPTKLVHTWQRVGMPGAATTVTYHLQPIDGGTRLTLRHTGFVPPDSCGNVCEGWQSSFERLARTLSAAATTSDRPDPPVGAAGTPQARAVSYFEALARKDCAAIRAMLADDGSFMGPLQSFTDADAFMNEAEIFMRLTKKVDIKKVLADGDDVCIFWDYTTIVPSIPAIPVAAWLTIADDKIKYFHLHFNPAAIVAAKEREEIAKALAGVKHE
jgi:uncharacterized protein YndB with AHSA1/START domain/ketosteroid isomerase-like protein